MAAPLRSKGGFKQLARSQSLPDLRRVFSKANQGKVDFSNFKTLRPGALKQMVRMWPTFQRHVNHSTARVQAFFPGGLPAVFTGRQQLVNTNERGPKGGTDAFVQKHHVPGDNVSKDLHHLDRAGEARDNVSALTKGHKQAVADAQQSKASTPNNDPGGDVKRLLSIFESGGPPSPSSSDATGSVDEKEEVIDVSQQLITLDPDDAPPPKKNEEIFEQKAKVIHPKQLDLSKPKKTVSVGLPEDHIKEQEIPEPSREGPGPVNNGEPGAPTTEVITSPSIPGDKLTDVKELVAKILVLIAEGKEPEARALLVDKYKENNNTALKAFAEINHLLSSHWLTAAGVGKSEDDRNIGMLKNILDEGQARLERKLDKAGNLDLEAVEEMRSREMKRFNRMLDVLSAVRDKDLGNDAQNLRKDIDKDDQADPGFGKVIDGFVKKAKSKNQKGSAAIKSAFREAVRDHHRKEMKRLGRLENEAKRAGRFGKSAGKGPRGLMSRNEELETKDTPTAGKASYAYTLDQGGHIQGKDAKTLPKLYAQNVRERAAMIVRSEGRDSYQRVILEKSKVLFDEMKQPAGSSKDNLKLEVLKHITEGNTYDAVDVLRAHPDKKEAETVLLEIAKDLHVGESGKDYKKLSALKEASSEKVRLDDSLGKSMPFFVMLNGGDEFARFIDEAPFLEKAKSLEESASDSTTEGGKLEHEVLGQLAKGNVRGAARRLDKFVDAKDAQGESPSKKELGRRKKVAKQVAESIEKGLGGNTPFLEMPGAKDAFKGYVSVNKAKSNSSEKSTAQRRRNELK